MILALFLFENEFLNIVAISFTALILNELIMVALEITIWCVLSLLCGALDDDILLAKACIHDHLGSRYPCHIRT